MDGERSDRFCWGGFEFSGEPWGRVPFTYIKQQDGTRPYGLSLPAMIQGWVYNFDPSKSGQSREQIKSALQYWRGYNKNSRLPKIEIEPTIGPALKAATEVANKMFKYYSVYGVVTCTVECCGD